MKKIFPVSNVKKEPVLIVQDIQNNILDIFILKILVWDQFPERYYQRPFEHQDEEIKDD